MVETELDGLLAVEGPNAERRGRISRQSAPRARHRQQQLRSPGARHGPARDRPRDQLRGEHAPVVEEDAGPQVDERAPFLFHREVLGEHRHHLAPLVETVQPLEYRLGQRQLGDAGRVGRVEVDGARRAVRRDLVPVGEPRRRRQAEGQKQGDHGVPPRGMKRR